MLELKNDVYQIGGIPISVLTEKYDTPIYVYDTAQVQILESLCVVKKSPTHV